tara:strand:+ start:1630 stop:1956 length:327 start_codon:yes stop_codon:yes gene_type:complete
MSTQIFYMSPDGGYPRFAGDIQEQYPDWEPDQPVPSDWREVEVEEQFEIEDRFIYPEGKTHEDSLPLSEKIFVAQAPVFNADRNKWVQSWTIETVEWVEVTVKPPHEL